MSLLHLLFSISTLLLLQRAVSIPLSEFFPFGTEAGDAELPSNDDGSSPAITLSTPFPFFAETETDLYVSLCMQQEYRAIYLIWKYYYKSTVGA